MAERPRCPELSCPVRYAGGLDRLCPDHGGDAQRDPYAALRATLAAAQRGEVRLSVIDALGDDGEALEAVRPAPDSDEQLAAEVRATAQARTETWRREAERAKAAAVTASRAARKRIDFAAELAVIARTPGRQAAADALLADPARSNRVIEAATPASAGTVARVRRELEQAGVIRRYRARSHDGVAWTPLQQKIRAELEDGPGRLNPVIAAAVGATDTTVARVRRELERARELHVWRYGRHVDGCWCAAA